MFICGVYSFLGMFSIFFFTWAMGFLVYDLVYFLEYKFVSFNSCNVEMVLLFDWMSLLFLSFVLFISCTVIKYSEDYMSGDLYIGRFICLVFMFVVSMIFLILSPNMISILLGWDGLGLVSYCLVIYYQNVKSYGAGMLTALSNRVGDVSILIIISWMLCFGSWNFMFYLQELKDNSIMCIITWLVVLAAMTKSAQIPFSSWLPAAMAAPTPVSSLVHSSTLVTAGVYLLIRFNFAFDQYLMNFLLFISSLTMFMSGLGANFEYDLKKIIALSTLSQLGLMMTILSLGEYKLAFFHLLSHALFKALLFMCAGSMIHSLGGCQDIRYMGGLVNLMPLTCCYFNICNLSLCGLPFLSGFYSKDLIAEVASMGYMNIYIYFLFYLSIGLTACYSFRLVYYLMVGDLNYFSLNGLIDGGVGMLKGMTCLIFLVVFMGSTLSWLIFSWIDVIILPFTFKFMTLLMVVLGLMLGYEMSKFSFHDSMLMLKVKVFNWFVSGMWGLPFLSTHGLNKYPLDLGIFYLKNLDQGWSEYFGSQNIFYSLTKSSSGFQLFMFNSIKIFFLLVVFWLFIMFFI